MEPDPEKGAVRGTGFQGAACYLGRSRARGPCLCPGRGKGRLVCREGVAGWGCGFSGPQCPHPSPTGAQPLIPGFLQLLGVHSDLSGWRVRGRLGVLFSSWRDAGPPDPQGRGRVVRLASGWPACQGKTPAPTGISAGLSAGRVAWTVPHPQPMPLCLLSRFLLL